MSNYGLIYPRLIGEGGPWNGWCYAEFTWSNPIREYAWEFKYVNEGDESVGFAAPVNYTPTEATLAGHLEGIDTALGLL